MTVNDVQITPRVAMNKVHNALCDQVMSPVQPAGNSPVASRGPCLVCQNEVLVTAPRIKCDGGYLHQECADKIKSGQVQPSPKLIAAIAASPALSDRLLPESSDVSMSPQVISREDLFAATSLQEVCSLPLSSLPAPQCVSV